MLPPIIWNTLLLIPVIFVFIVPWVAALFSKQATFPRKLWWALCSLLLSWIGYFIWYYLFLKLPRDRNGIATELDS